MAATMSVLGQILSSYLYLRSAMVWFLLVHALSDLFLANLISLLSEIQKQGLQCSCIYYFHNLKHYF